jgi:hypothetical protein
MVNWISQILDIQTHRWYPRTLQGTGVVNVNDAGMAMDCLSTFTSTKNLHVPRRKAYTDRLYL